MQESPSGQTCFHLTFSFSRCSASLLLARPGPWPLLLSFSSRPRSVRGFNCPALLQLSGHGVHKTRIRIIHAASGLKPARDRRQPVVSRLRPSRARSAFVSSADPSVDLGRPRPTSSQQSMRPRVLEKAAYQVSACQSTTAGSPGQFWPTPRARSGLRYPERILWGCSHHRPSKLCKSSG